MGIVYKITSPTNKMYIGITIGTLEDRWKNHNKKSSNCRILKNAINYYGKDNMKIEKIIEVDNYYLNLYERFYIKLYNTLAPNGMNCTSGGEYHKRLSDETKQKISEKVKQKHKENNKLFLGSIKQKSNGKFEARKTMGNIQHHLGTFDTREQARTEIDKFIETGVKPIKINDRVIEKFVYKFRNGWLVQKNNNGKKIYLGTYKNYEDAVNVARESQ